MSDLNSKTLLFGWSPDIWVDAIVVLLDLQSDLQERLGLIDMEEHIGGRDRRIVQTRELGSTSSEQFKLAINEMLEEIARLEREI